jgi:2-iminobutanoate/2-iminopropanoate deaminase
MHIILSPHVPKPGGHYSQATVHNGTVYTAGLLAIRSDGEKMVDASAKEQALLCLEHLRNILQEANSRMDLVLKCTVFISDLAYWPEVNEAFAATFGAHKPARSIVPVSPLHYGLKVEIEAIAAVAGGFAP